MKVRNGFVSNSSSSSFIISIKDDKMTKAELKEKSLAILDKAFGFSSYTIEEDKQHYISKAEKASESGEYIAMVESIDTSFDMDIEKFAYNIVELCGFNKDRITFSWMDR